MPFTPTHIVAVLPFWPWRRFFPFTALAIGSMVPDATLFFPFVDYQTTHSPVGAFSTCLPLGVVLFLLFEALMRRPLVSLLPAYIQRRLPTQLRLPSTSQISPHVLFFAGIATAILMGAFSHQVWDSFTHKGRWGTSLFPVLNSEFRIAGFDVPGYKAFQYGSTFVGLPVITWLASVWLIRAPPLHVEDKTIPLQGKGFAAVTIILVPTAVAIYSFIAEPSYYRALGTTIQLAGAAIAVLCVVYCVSFQVLVGRDLK